MVLYILTISKTSRNSSTGMDDSHVGSFWLAEDSFIWLKQIKFRLATIIEYRLKICRSSQSSFDILKPFSLYKKKTLISSRRAATVLTSSSRFFAIGVTASASTSATTANSLFMPPARHPVVISFFVVHGSSVPAIKKRK